MSSLRISALAILAFMAPTMFIAVHALATEIVPSPVLILATMPATPPNVVEINPALTTAGQPSAFWLSTLKVRGYESVINLAPLDTGETAKDEAQIVEQQGLSYVHIPIELNQPVKRDLDRFAAAMLSAGHRKILVYCQINQRSSSMVFLYRVIYGKEDPQVAAEALCTAWVPSGVWKHFIEEQLKENGIAFDFL